MLCGQAIAADKLVVGVVSRGASLQWPMYVAIDKGLLAAENIELDVIAGQSSAGVMQQLASGSIDIGPPGDGGQLSSARRVPRSWCSEPTSSGPVHLLLAKPDIRTVPQLKGKTITVGSVQGIDLFYLENKLARDGLKPVEYNVISAGSTTARYSALMSGAVDAAVLTAPQYFPAEASGYNNLGPVEYTTPFPFTSYVAFKPWLRRTGRWSHAS